jgi:tRNA A-37 threonylcarbamoyl transferase component Bud32
MTLDWDRVTALFGAARMLDAPSRDAFLAVACGDDPALRTQVEALLAADVDDAFLEQPAAGEVKAALEALLGPGAVVKSRYRIEQPLGGGGQGLIYRATDEVLSRAVVIKVMRAAGRVNQALKARFVLEMEALSRIDHAGVVGILDVGELGDGSPFLVMQHIDGVSLRELLDAGPLQPARAAAILRQLGAALGAAHAAGVAHQDLKPENVMLQRQPDGRETVKLIDFGNAKVDRAQIAAGLTTVMVAGTIRYMAPEQFRGENSPACDVYALALLACEMLTGQPDARALPRRAGARLRRLVDGALAWRAEDRPGDITRWSEAMAHAMVEGERFGRRLLVRVAAALLMITASAAGARALLVYYVEPVRIMEKVGAFDPLQEGFLPHNGVTGTVAPNPERDGYEGWRVFATGPGDYYYRMLTRAQKRRAMDRGWTLSAVMRADEGAVFAHVDFVGFGKRYGVAVIRDADRDRVLLQTRILPTLDGLEVHIPHAPGVYHRYELRYDPGLQSAALWIDGNKRLDEFRGLAQFQDDMGLFFGAGPYRSTRGVGSFQSVRFEINP